MNTYCFKNANEHDDKENDRENKQPFVGKFLQPEETEQLLPSFVGAAGCCVLW